MEIWTELHEKGFPLLIGVPEEGFPLVRFKDKSGGVIEKEVLPEALCQLISDSLVEEKWLETPLLPKGCIRHAQFGDKQKFLIYVPGEARDTWLFDQRIENLPFPHLIFGFVLNGKVVTKKCVVAVKDTLITEGTQLYKYPYSNVYEDAQACWNGLPEIQEAFQVGTLPELFFASPDNGHLFSDAQGYRELVEGLQGKSFPYDRLVKRKETIAEFWAWL